MTEAQPPSTDADESRSWPRFLARTSIFAAITCCTMNCVLFQLTAKQPGGPSELANAVVGYSSLLIVILGFFAGLVAFFQGFRQQTRDTSIIASLGLILCGGILFLMVWFLLLLQNAKGPKASAPSFTIAHHQKIASSGQPIG